MTTSRISGMKTGLRGRGRSGASNCSGASIEVADSRTRMRIKTMLLQRCILALLAPACFASSTVSLAQTTSTTDRSAALVNAAHIMLDEGRLDTAQELLERAYAIRSEPAILKYLALIQERKGDLIRARDLFSQWFVMEPDPIRRAEAKRSLDEVSARISGGPLTKETLPLSDASRMTKPVEVDEATSVTKQIAPEPSDQTGLGSGMDPGVSSESYFLSVFCLPSGSTVRLDDKVIGHTPLHHHPLPPGLHRLEIRSDRSYKPLVLELMVQGDVIVRDELERTESLIGEGHRSGTHRHDWIRFRSLIGPGALWDFALVSLRSRGFMWTSIRGGGGIYWQAASSMHSGTSGFGGMGYVGTEFSYWWRLNQHHIGISTMAGFGHFFFGPSDSGDDQNYRVEGLLLHPGIRYRHYSYWPRNGRFGFEVSVELPIVLGEGRRNGKDENYRWRSTGFEWATVFPFIGIGFGM